MARTNHSLVSFIRYAMLGTLAGAGLVLIAGTLFISSAPQRYEATVVLFHLPRSGMSDSARDFVATTLAQPEFLASVVAKHGWDSAIVKHLADDLRVGASNADGSVAELRLRGSESATLATTLEALVGEMITLHADKQKATFQPLLNDLDHELKAARERLRKFQTSRGDFSSLPPAARSTIIVTTDLARKRLELELLGRYRVQAESVADDTKRQRQLNALIAIQAERRQKPVKDVDIQSPLFKHASELAYADMEVLALEQTKRRLDSELELRNPLIVERDAVVTPLATEYRSLALLTAAGGLLGGLIAGLVGSYRRSSAMSLSASVVEKYLNIPVAGVTAQFLTDYGERERRVLADSRPDSDTEHLAVAGIRSVRVALHLLARTNPVIFCEIGDRRHASHIIANLAVVAAQAGERVLIVDRDNGEPVLAKLFASDTTAAQPIAADVDVDAIATEVELRSDTRSSLIRFLGRDTIENLADVKTLPVAPEILAGFDRIFIYAGALDTAKRFLSGNPASIGIVVCAIGARLSVLRKARIKTMHGVLLGGYLIDEQTYRDGPTAGNIRLP